MPERTEVYKIGVNIPGEFLDRLMDEVTASIEPLYPKYDRTFMYWPVKGTWRPLDGADPFDGKVDEISVADEIRIEFAVRDDYLKAAVEAIVRVHPYEEPAIDIIPMVGWRELILPSDDT